MGNDILIYMIIGFDFVFFFFFLPFGVESRKQDGVSHVVNFLFCFSQKLIIGNQQPPTEDSIRKHVAKEFFNTSIWFSPPFFCRKP